MFLVPCSATPNAGGESVVFMSGDPSSSRVDKSGGDEKGVIPRVVGPAKISPALGVVGLGASGHNPQKILVVVDLNEYLCRLVQSGQHVFPLM